MMPMGVIFRSAFTIRATPKSCCATGGLVAIDRLRAAQGFHRNGAHIRRSERRRQRCRLPVCEGKPVYIPGPTETVACRPMIAIAFW